MVERGDLVLTPDNVDGQLWLSHTQRVIEQLDPEAQLVFGKVMHNKEFEHEFPFVHNALKIQQGGNEGKFLKRKLNIQANLWELFSFQFVLGHLKPNECLTSPVKTKRIYNAAECGLPISKRKIVSGPILDYADLTHQPRPDGILFIQEGNVSVIRKIFEYKFVNRASKLKGYHGQIYYFSSGEVVYDLFRAGGGFIEDLGRNLHNQFGIPSRLYFDRRNFAVTYIRQMPEVTSFISNVEYSSAPILKPEFESVVDAFFQDVRSQMEVVQAIE